MNLTKMVWEKGRSEGLTAKEIRGNWKSLWNDIYDDTIRVSNNGIENIFNELEKTIKSFTKSAQTEEAELESLENIRTIVEASKSQNGIVETFNKLSEIYDNGAGEWIQRIVSAIYDRELAGWSSGLPQYLSRLQSEISEAFDVDSSQLTFGTSFLQSDNNYNPLDYGSGQPMDISELLKLSDSGIGLD